MNGLVATGAIERKWLRARVFGTLTMQGELCAFAHLDARFFTA
jgi:hypothetical protein